MEYCMGADDDTAAIWNRPPDLDLDGDGRLDAIGLDFDGDGMRDDALADFDGDGVALSRSGPVAHYLPRSAALLRHRCAAGGRQSESHPRAHRPRQRRVLPGDLRPCA